MAKDQKPLYVRPDTHKRTRILAIEMSLTVDQTITAALDALETARRQRSTQDAATRARLQTHIAETLADMPQDISRRSHIEQQRWLMHQITTTHGTPTADRPILAELIAQALT